MPTSASSSTAFTPDEPRSTPSSRRRPSGTPRRIDEALHPFRVDFIPRVAVALQRTADDATVGETEELLDRLGSGAWITPPPVWATTTAVTIPSIKIGRWLASRCLAI